MLTKDQIRNRFEYYDGSVILSGVTFCGLLIDKFPSNRIKVRIREVGIAVAGTVSKREKANYIRINIDGKLHYLHRLIWQYFNDDLTDDIEVDHRDGNTQDSRIKNLRTGNGWQNRMNRAGHGNLEYIGVSQHGKSWRARVMFNRQEYFAGSHPFPHAAALARDRLARHLFGDRARLNFPDLW